MIGIYDFMAMDDIQKGEAIFSRACLGDRQEDGHLIQLYRVDEVYVEVLYDPVLNQITRFLPFTTSELLVPYINIKDGFVQ
ncbi:hypothetical protein BDD43_4276 [Mucilaginibacter gracilis]|uniref:Uncharacterized protein n=1 Tax=Mucilaginibacter gracilis TaxID=423350 RepID=A0A495J6P8_9SPHI|nr:hypothetical protein [Mucilaginibacter gracilis]RKR84054.1 hypothetical protein BDD43_4276 [Mucilaginibacter gracilis]